MFNALQAKSSVLLHNFDERGESHVNLGKLERVELRDVWANEATDFTPWLAKPENLTELSKTLYLELELTAQEQFVGPYRADLLCADSVTQGYVLIENQLEKTDHGHLGQTLTYAAGLGAKTVIWIAAAFTEEHRAALDWLNEITDEEYSFFGLEIELWRIGESTAAPKFNVVCRPNNWARKVKEAAKSDTGELSETKQLQLRYWTAFKDYILQNAKPLKPQKPLPQHWSNFSIGRSGFGLVTTVNTLEDRIGAELDINLDKAAFEFFFAERDAINAEFGGQLDWQELPEGKMSRIAIYKQGCDIKNELDWPAQFQWLADALTRLDKVFRPRVKAYQPVHSAT
ncbi:DUF4268 domain-containing protein [Burkholderia ubonensis]|uniref:DUF4268 domain-containing protein n=1 Tax=Burkholderia ubonensis TaxID=101571 RepID=UPI0018E15AB2|nr:DUF4268 domain-containing protein [Burkholderia ubonensis]